MHNLQYAGPYDTFDASNIVGKPGTIFHTPLHAGVAPDLRGNVIAVTNEVYEQLMTYPNHRFVEVEDTAAKELAAKQAAARTVREQQEALFAAEPANAGVRIPSIQQQIDALPVAAADVAPSAPRTAAQIKAEVKAEAQSATGVNNG